MTECRTIQESEAPSYLRVLCRIFDLDYARAESVFYHEPFFDLNRKWALFEDGKIRAVMTTVPLHFGDGPAIGIAGVGTLPDFRCRGYGQTLVEAALASSEQRAALFAQQTTLYERRGFEVMDQVIRAPFQEVPIDADADLLMYGEVREIYEAWARLDPRRLHRDETRWGYWKWNLRMCTRVGGGYICQEGETVRECVLESLPSAWPVFERGEWFGLRVLADEMALPIHSPANELIFMGKGFSDVPRMFMTDQF